MAKCGSRRCGFFWLGSISCCKRPVHCWVRRISSTTASSLVFPFLVTRCNMKRGQCKSGRALFQYSYLVPEDLSCPAKPSVICFLGRSQVVGTTWKVCLFRSSTPHPNHLVAEARDRWGSLRNSNHSKVEAHGGPLDRRPVRVVPCMAGGGVRGG